MLAFIITHGCGTAPKPGLLWSSHRPAAFWDSQRSEVTAVSGSEPDELPQPIKECVFLCIWQHGEAAPVGDPQQIIPRSVGGDLEKISNRADLLQVWISTLLDASANSYCEEHADRVRSLFSQGHKSSGDRVFHVVSNSTFNARLTVCGVSYCHFHCSVSTDHEGAPLC